MDFIVTIPLDFVVCRAGESTILSLVIIHNATTFLFVSAEGRLGLKIESFPIFFRPPTIPQEEWKTEGTNERVFALAGRKVHPVNGIHRNFCFQAVPAGGITTRIFHDATTFLFFFLELDEYSLLLSGHQHQATSTQGAPQQYFVLRKPTFVNKDCVDIKARALA